MFKWIFFYFSIFFIVSCDEEKLCSDQLEKYPWVVTDNLFVTFDESDDGCFHLYYNREGKVVKRVGGTGSIRMDIPNQYFSDEIFDTIIYTDNQIVVRNYLNLKLHGKFYLQLLKEKTFLLSDDGQFIKSYLADYIFRHYFYNVHDQIIRTVDSIKLTDENVFVTDAYYRYAKDGNLVQIEFWNKDWSPNYEYIDTTYMNFSNFDDANNPFRELQIFDDSFVRSLSKNNFTRYDSEFRGSGEFIFSYDDCGNLRFNNN